VGAESPWAVPSTPPPGATPAPSPSPSPSPAPAPGWGTSVGPSVELPSTPRSEAEERHETNRHAILPRGIFGIGLSIGANLAADHERAIHFPILVRAPMGPVELELQLDSVLGLLSDEDDDRSVAGSFGNPYLGIYGSFGGTRLFLEAGLGFSFPAAQTLADDDLDGYRPANLAAAMTGYWDVARFFGLSDGFDLYDDFVGVVPHVRGDLVLDHLSVAAELDLPFLIAIGNTREFYEDDLEASPREAFMQIAVEAAFRFLGSSLMGIRFQQVVFLSEGWSERYQAAFEPFFRLAPRGRGYLRAGLLINAGQLVNVSDVIAFTLTSGTVF
jgi:hypothetical protein